VIANINDDDDEDEEESLYIMTSTHKRVLFLENRLQEQIRQTNQTSQKEKVNH
jgi:hypothetical protein